MPKDDRYYPQKRMRSQNRNKIIDILSEQPLTFQELIDESEISRAVVNDILKNMEKEGLIEKEYENGKLKNVLKLSKLDFVEWFLDQLRILRVPEKLLKQGKEVLTEQQIVFSNIFVKNIRENFLLLLQSRYKNKLKLEQSLENPFNFLYNIFLRKEPTLTKKPTGFVKLKGVSPELYTKVILSKSSVKNKKTSKKTPKGRKLGLLINPTIFHVAIKMYEIEKVYWQTLPQLDKNWKESLKLCLTSLNDQVKEEVEKVIPWWDDVSFHVPGLVTVSFLLDCYVDLLNNPDNVKKIAKEKRHIKTATKNEFYDHLDILS